MTTSLWIALGSLAFAIEVQAIIAAFALGKAFQRISQVERDTEDRASTSSTVIELKVKMEHVEEQMRKQSGSLEGINRQLGNIAMNRVGFSGELK